MRFDLFQGVHPVSPGLSYLAPPLFPHAALVAVLVMEIHDERSAEKQQIHRDYYHSAPVKQFGERRATAMAEECGGKRASEHEEYDARCVSTKGTP